MTNKTQRRNQFKDCGEYLERRDFEDVLIERVKICSCGEEVFLACQGHYPFTSTCDKCDKDYNSSGQELAPREQWGEETGEHWSDCY